MILYTACLLCTPPSFIVVTEKLENNIEALKAHIEDKVIGSSREQKPEYLGLDLVCTVYVLPGEPKKILAYFKDFS